MDLYLVGLGIQARAHLTNEGRKILRDCRVIVHIGEDHQWLRTLNKNVVNLEDMYWTGSNRYSVYRRINDRVIEELDNGPGVALVTDGHPLLFDDQMHGLLRYCRKSGRAVKVVSGISCLDTLAVDLRIDYGDGVQIYDCSDLVVSRYRLNTGVHTVLLQLGEYDFDQTTDALDMTVAGRYESLIRYLARYYPTSHRVCIVFSDDGDGAKLVRLPLRDLDRRRSEIFPGTTLYVPPLKA